MNPFAFIIVLAIIIGALVVFTPAIFTESVASFPLFSALSEKRAQQNAVSFESATLLRTVDGGKTWFPQVSIDSESTIPSVTVSFITADLLDSNIMLAGTEGQGLYKTVNNGQNWEKLFDRNKVLSETAVVYRVVQDPTNVNRLYVAAFQNKFGVFLKSEDGGLSFTQTYISQLENYPVYAIAIHPRFSNIVYMGTGQGGVFMSEDFGETWQVREWLTGAVTDIVVNPRVPSELYAVATARGLFRSVDGGLTWDGFSKKLSRISAQSAVLAFRMDPSNSNVLYLALRNGVVRSTDRGETWSFLEILIPPKTLPIDTVAINPRNAQNIYVAVANQLYISEDGGINWSIQKLATTKRIGTIILDPKEPINIFLGMKVVKERNNKSF